jgi:hypothetical protein
MNDDLPPLPQRTHGFDAEPLYTAEQMRGYAADRIEAQAARIAELEARLCELLDACGDAGWWLESSRVGCMDAARAALAPKESSRTRSSAG